MAESPAVLRVFVSNPLRMPLRVGRWIVHLEAAAGGAGTLDVECDGPLAIPAGARGAPVSLTLCPPAAAVGECVVRGVSLVAMALPWRAGLLRPYKKRDEDRAVGVLLLPPMPSPDVTVTYVRAAWWVAAPTCVAARDARAATRTPWRRTRG